MTRLLDLHVTCPDEASATDIATAALSARLVACASVSGPVQSLFHWQGRIQSETEWQLSCKTHDGKLEDLLALIRARHPYDLPVVTWAPVGMDSDAAAWLRDETGG